MGVKDAKPLDPDEEFKDDTKIVPPVHLAALNDNQRKFVAAFLKTGSAAAAAEEAGYGGKDKKYCSQRGYELMHLDKIRTAITAEQLQFGHGLRSAALKVWHDVLNDPMNTIEVKKLKLAAAKEIADRFGLHKITASVNEVTHTHQFANMPTKDVEAFIRDKIAATKMVVDATAEDITDAEAAIDIPSFQELKGLPAPDPEQNFNMNSPDMETIKERVRELTLTPEQKLRRAMGETDDE